MLKIVCTGAAVERSVCVVVVVVGGGGGLIPKCSAGWAVDVRDYPVLFTWPRATRATTSGGPY